MHMPRYKSYLHRSSQVKISEASVPTEKAKKTWCFIHGNITYGTLHDCLKKQICFPILHVAIFYLFASLTRWKFWQHSKFKIKSFQIRYFKYCNSINDVSLYVFSTSQWHLPCELTFDMMHPKRPSVLCQMLQFLFKSENFFMWKRYVNKAILQFGSNSRHLWVKHHVNY